MYKVYFKNVSAVGISHGCPDKEFVFEIEATTEFDAMRLGIKEMRAESLVEHPDCYYNIVVEKPLRQHNPDTVKADIRGLKDHLIWALSKANMVDPRSPGSIMNEINEVRMALKMADERCRAITREVKGITLSAPESSSLGGAS